MTIKSGTISFNGYTFFVSPENYNLLTKGTQSQLIPTSNGYYIEPGYSFYGFNIKTAVLDANVINSIEELARTSWSTRTPLNVTDTVHPSGNKTWKCFIELPVIKLGAAENLTVTYLPGRLITEGMELTFVDTTLRRT